jgi:hypothetical protein
MTITYDVATNVLKATNVPIGSPVGFIDFWNADKAGTLSLHARTGITGVDASPVNLTRNARPTDRVVLGGAKQDLYIIVTAWTNMTSATVRLLGTDTSDAAQTEDLNITGNGTYYATKYFKTLTQSQVTAFTKSDSGSFAYEVKQAQWGVVWKQGSTQFQLDAKIDLSDGLTDVYFVDTEKQVTFSNGVVGVAYGSLIRVRGYGHFRLGILDDASSKTGSRGCTIISLESSITNGILLNNEGDIGVIELYATTLDCPNAEHRLSIKNTDKIYGCSFVNNVLPRLCVIDLFSLITAKGNAALYGTSGTLDRVLASGFTYAFQAYENYAALNISNVTIRNCTYIMQGTRLSVDQYLKNVDSNTWLFYWSGTGAGKVYRQYTLDIKVTDKDNNPLSGATVVVKDKDGNTIFSVTTAADGTITQQTVNRGYYTQANGNTLTDYSPHTLTISKAGYQTYVKKFTLGAAVNWEIKLAKAQAVLINSGNPVLNLLPADPENKLVMTL